MRRTPVILGVIAMSLGGLATLSSLGGLVGRHAMKGVTLAFGDWMARLPRQRGQPSPDQTMKRILEAQDGVWNYQLALSLGLAVLSVIVIFIGWGLYHRRPWARSASIGWAIAALLFLPVMVWLQAFVIQGQVVRASMAPLTASARDANLMRMMSSFQIAAAAAGTLAFYAPFPAVLLGLMVRKSAKSDFVAPPSP